jgi:hypothetical protein
MPSSRGPRTVAWPFGQLQAFAPVKRTVIINRYLETENPRKEICTSGNFRISVFLWLVDNDSIRYPQKSKAISGSLSTTRPLESWHPNQLFSSFTSSCIHPLPGGSAVMLRDALPCIGCRHVARPAGKANAAPFKIRTQSVCNSFNSSSFWHSHIMSLWIPLESNPEVMNEFLTKIGVPDKLQICDIFVFVRYLCNCKCSTNRQRISCSKNNINKENLTKKISWALFRVFAWIFPQ